MNKLLRYSIPAALVVAANASYGQISIQQHNGLYTAFKDGDAITDISQCYEDLGGSREVEGDALVVKAYSDGYFSSSSPNYASFIKPSQFSALKCVTALEGSSAKYADYRRKSDAGEWDWSIPSPSEFKASVSYQFENPNIEESGYFYDRNFSLQGKGLTDDFTEGELGTYTITLKSSVSNDTLLNVKGKILGVRETSDTSCTAIAELGKRNESYESDDLSAKIGTKGYTWSNSYDGESGYIDCLVDQGTNIDDLKVSISDEYNIIQAIDRYADESEKYNFTADDYDVEIDLSNGNPFPFELEAGSVYLYPFTVHVVNSADNSEMTFNHAAEVIGFYREKITINAYQNTLDIPMNDVYYEVQKDETLREVIGKAELISSSADGNLYRYVYPDDKDKEYEIVVKNEDFLPWKERTVFKGEEVLYADESYYSSNYIVRGYRNAARNGDIVSGEWNSSSNRELDYKYDSNTGGLYFRLNPNATPNTRIEFKNIDDNKYSTEYTYDEYGFGTYSAHPAVNISNITFINASNEGEQVKEVSVVLNSKNNWNEVIDFEPFYIQYTTVFDGDYDSKNKLITSSSDLTFNKLKGSGALNGYYLNEGYTLSKGSSTSVTPYNQTTYSYRDSEEKFVFDRKVNSESVDYYMKGILGDDLVEQVSDSEDTYFEQPIEYLLDTKLSGHKILDKTPWIYDSEVGAPVYSPDSNLSIDQFFTENEFGSFFSGNKYSASYK